MTNLPINFSEIDAGGDLTLRDYQIENKRKIYQVWQQSRSVMLQMPTGTGKTRLFVSLAKDLHNWGIRHNRTVKILFLAHRKELIDQISTSVGVKYGLAHGMIVAQSMENRQYPIQVGSVPTLNRRLQRWADNDFDVIIIDEAHHVKANSYRKIIHEYPTAKILGVTATPYRLNGAGFRPEFDELIVSPPVAEFIRRGYLCDYEYYSIKSESILQLKINNMALSLDGDYMDSAMMEVMDQDTIRASIVDTYLKFAKGKKGIVYTVNRGHNAHVCEKFCEAGIRAVAIDSKTPKEQRDRFVEDFRNGKIDILCNVNIFSEGFDCPDVEFVQLARPTKSLSMFLQQIGRGLRPSEGKSKAIILDNVGLYNKFGFPSARRKWQYHFEGRDVEEEENYRRERDEEGDDHYIMYIDEGNDEINLLHASNEEDVEVSEEQISSQNLSILQPPSIKYNAEELNKLLSVIDYMRQNGFSIPKEMIDRRVELLRAKEWEENIETNRRRTFAKVLIAKYGLQNVNFSIDYNPTRVPDKLIELL